MFLKNTTNLEQIKDLLQLYNCCPYCQSNLVFRLSKHLPIITIEKTEFDYFHNSVCYGDARRSIMDHFDYPTTSTKIKFKLDSLNVDINLDTRELTKELVIEYDASVPQIFTQETLYDILATLKNVQVVESFLITFNMW